MTKTGRLAIATTIDPKLYKKNKDPKPISSKLEFIASVSSILKYVQYNQSVGSISNAAICIMNPKKTPALAGKLIENKGIITMICCVLIIDQSYCNEAERKMFSTMFPAIIAFVAPPIYEPNSASLLPKPSGSYMRGSTLISLVSSLTVRPCSEKKK